MAFTKTPPSEAEAAARRWADDAPALGADGTTGPEELPELVTVHLRLSRAEHEALKAIAEEELSTLQRLLRVEVRRRIAEHAQRRAG